MKDSRIVMAVHPESRMRILLRSMLQDPSRTVLTDHSWTDLLADRESTAPAIILLDRSFLGQDCVDVLSLIHERWPDAEIVILPEALESGETCRDAMIQLMRHVDRLLAMKSTRELLTEPA